MGNNIDIEIETIKILEAILDDRMPKQIAAKLFIDSKSLNKEEFLNDLIEKKLTMFDQYDDQAVSDLIILFHALDELDTEKSRKTIMKYSLRINSELLLSSILKSLARICDRHSLKVVLPHIENNSDHIRKLARFAASVISYRHNIEGNELERPKDSDFLSLGSIKKQIVISISNSSIRHKYDEFIEKKYYQLQLDDRLSLELSFSNPTQPYELSILFDQDLVRKGFRKLVERKALVAIAVSKLNERQQNYARYLVFSSPSKTSKNAADILVTDIDGDICVCGSMEIEKTIAISLRSVRSFGIPVIIKGSFDGNTIQMRQAEYSSPLSAEIHLKTE
jgi:hypothetical protein